jgi:hypothetical protein
MPVVQVIGILTVSDRPCVCVTATATATLSETTSVKLCAG